MAYDNNMKGTLGANKRKKKDTHPTHRGSCELEGVEYWISAWVRENSSTGEKFFSLAFQRKDEKPKDEKPRIPGTIKSLPGGYLDVDTFDDDVPF